MELPDTITVRLEWGDFLDGECASPSRCAIALAVHRAVPGAYAEVTMHSVYLYTDQPDELGGLPDRAAFVRYPLPDWAREVVREFDRALNVHEREHLAEQYDGNAFTACATARRTPVTATVPL